MSTIETFTATSLARWLHDLPRYNRRFHRTTNQFNETDLEYWEGVVMMTTPFALMAILTILFFIIRCFIFCCKCCCCKPKKEYKPKPKCLMYTFLVTCLIVVGGCVYGFIANQQISDGVDEIRAAIQTLDDFGTTSVDEIRVIDTQLTNLDATVQTLSADLVSAGISASEVNDIQNFLSQAQNAITTGVDAYDSIPFERVRELMDEYDGYRWAAQLGLLCFLFLPYLIVLVAIPCKSRCLLWQVTWVSVLCAFLAWLLSGIEVAATVVLGDVCHNATEYALERSQDIGNQEAIDLVRYYVVCEGIVNPLQNELDAADSALDSIQGPINDLETIVNAAPISQPQIDSLLAELVSLSGSTNTTLTATRNIINTLFDCTEPHNALVQALNGICNSTLGGLFGLIIAQVILAFCVWMAIFCAIYFLAYVRNRKYEDEGDEPGQGLAKSLSFMYGRPADNASAPAMEMQPLAKGKEAV